MLRAKTQFADCVQRLFSLRCRFPQVVLLASFAVLAGSAGRCGPRMTILKLVPEQARGFVVVNRPAAADAKLQQLGQQMNLPIPSLLAKLQGEDGIRKGLDTKRPIAFLVLPPKDESGIPSMIVLIPVSDYAKFLEQFESKETEAGITKIQLWASPTLVRSVGGYAALTALPFREALEKDVKLADEVPAGLAEWRTWLTKQDAGAVVLAPGIRMLSAKVQQGIAALKPLMAAAGEQQAKQAEAGLDMYVKLFQAAEKQVASYGLGVDRDPQGVLRISRSGPPRAWRRLGQLRRGGHTVEAKRPRRTAGRALRLRWRRSALRDGDRHDDESLFQHDEETCTTCTD